MDESGGYQEKQDILFARWKLARPDYEDATNGRHFVVDGVVDFSLWHDAKPKILFLLKEAWCAADEWEPCWGITSIANGFSRNIARWRSILHALYRDREQVLTFANLILPETVNDVALVEVKKLNEGRTASSYGEIIGYATRDRGFLREQIEIINLEVIFCCYTVDAYDVLFPEAADEPCLELSRVAVKWNKNHCHCYAHHQRLVIDFYHPSIRGGHDEELFEMLGDLLQNGRVFDHFSWGKRSGLQVG